MKAYRPVYLNILRIRLPIPGIVSILHRVSGVVIFLGLPLLLYLLHYSLISQESFDRLTTILEWPELKLILWVILSAVTWHVIAGIRHLLMDMGFAETLKGGRISGLIVIVLSAAIILLLGMWLWL